MDRHADAARRKLEEQENLSIEQQTAQLYKAYEAEMRRSQGGETPDAARQKLEELEQLSIEQQAAQQYKAFEAEQQRKNMASRGKVCTLEEQEDISIQQVQALTLQIRRGHQSTPKTKTNISQFSSEFMH